MKVQRVRRIEAIRVDGQTRRLEAIDTDRALVVIDRGVLSTASVKDEWFSEPFGEPQAIVQLLKETKPRVDIFTFVQRLPQTAPKYEFPMVGVDLAALPVRSLDHWLACQARREVRKKLRKAEKHGVNCRVVPFDDDLVRGIVAIYNEAPVRQEKAFWHYGKSFETVKEEASTYLQSSTFVGAYWAGELIGFIKLVAVDGCGCTMHVISMIRHRDKAPTNALLAKAVEVCAENGYPYLQYGEWIEGSLGDFKRYHGFEKFTVPRYYVPLSALGGLAIRLNLHREFRALMPKGMRRWITSWRKRIRSIESGAGS